MGRTKIILLLTFALVLGAGVVVGRLWTRLPEAVHATNNDRPRPWFDDQLELTPDQRQQMDAIWSDVGQKMDKGRDRYRAIDKERDQAIQSLLSTDQKAAYDKIQADARAKRAEMDKERERLLHDANERSRALLSDSQKQRWDALREMHQHHGPRGQRGGPGGPRPTTGPSPAPATAPVTEQNNHF